MNKWFVLILILIVLGIGGFFALNNYIYNEKQAGGGDSTTVNTSTGITVKPTISSNYPGSVAYSSSKLGIEFNYLPMDHDAKFATSESGNKVYVSDERTNPEDGQFVEVFQKSEGESLEDAIKSKFLAGKSDKDCWVIDTTANFKNYPSSYKTAEITFPKPSGDDAPWWVLGSQCSPEYAQSNGIRYFLEDTNHPDRFVFISIGQYAIKAGETIAWQDTIRFLD